MADTPYREAVAVVVVSGVGNERPGSGRDIMVSTLLADPDARWRAAHPRSMRLTAAAAAGAPPPDDPTQLTTGEGAPEHTEVFEVATAEVEAAGDRSDVHVYEMYWADLSRAQGALSRVFYLLMAITLQMSTIGLEAVRRFRERGGSDGRPVRALQWLMNAVSYWLVYVIVPITLTMVTLLMLLNAQVLMPRRSGGGPYVPDAVTVWVVAVAGALLGLWIARRIVGGGWTFLRPVDRSRDEDRHVWLILALTVAAGSLGVLGALREPNREFLLLVCAACAIIAVAMTLDMQFAVRDDGVWLPGRTRAIQTGFALGPLAAGFVVTFDAGAGRTADLLAAISLRLDRFAWLVLLAGVVATAVLTTVVRMVRRGDADERRRLSASVAITFVLGPLLFSVVTTGIFVFFSYLSRIWPGGYPSSWSGAAPGTPRDGVFTNPTASDPTALSPRAWGNEMIERMVQPLGAALAWAALLVVVLLVFAWPYLMSLKHRADRPRHRSINQGRNFSRILERAGSGWMFIAGSLAWSVLTLAVAVVFWIPNGSIDAPGMALVERWSQRFGYWAVLGLVVATAAAVGLKDVGAIRFVGRPLARALTAALDVVYDIASYLRIGQPGIVAPRIKMVARYRALLSHLADRGYGRVVVCAHSQGTQLTYATLAGDPDRLPATPPLGTVPANLEVVTYGSPLAQTYRRRLPGQFAAMGPPLPVARLTRQVNLYRAGDYIGRSLQPVQEPADPALRFVAGRFSERCLGTGHHTGYGNDERWRHAIRSLIAHPAPFTAADVEIPGGAVTPAD